MTLLGRIATDALVLAVYELHSDCIEMRYKRRDKVAQKSMPRRAREGENRGLERKKRKYTRNVCAIKFYVYEIIDFMMVNGPH